MVASAKPEKFKPPVFHQIELARGWRILRQHTKIHVDLHRRALWGSASFDVSALNHQFVNIALNLRRSRVRSCQINRQPAPFRLISPLDDDELLQAVSSSTSRHRIKDIEYSVRLRDDAALTQAELVVDLPVNISADIVSELSEAYAQAKQNGAAEEDTDPNAAPAVPLDQLPVLNLHIEYEVLDAAAGALYYGNRDAPNPVLDPVYMLTESRFGVARFWMPCIESTYWCDRYLFDFDVAVDPDFIVIASGELVETVLYINDELKSEPDPEEPVKVFKYRSHAPSHASEVVLAVGPFIPLPDPTLPKTVTHFCLPGYARELVHTSPPLFAKAIAFCRDYFGADPPTSSFKQLFVGSHGRRVDTTVTGAGGIIVYSGDLLHTQRAIDEGFMAREAVMSGLVMSYFGRFLRPRSGEDDWLIMGLASHVTALGLQVILGRNWYRFRILDTMDKLCKEKSVDLSDTRLDRVTDATLDAVKRRSHIIVYLVERRIGGDVLRRALRDIVAEGKSVTVALVKLLENVLAQSRDVPNGLMRSNGGVHSLKRSRVLTDLNGNGLDQSSISTVVSTGFDEAQQGVSVGPFLKRLRAICGTELRSMVRHWASSPGVPRWQVGYQYNPRKHAIEFVLKQEGVLKGSQYGGRNGLFFTGSLHVRVMEIEGASDHTIELRDPIFVGDLPCHSRRAKHKSAAQAEKEFNENPARASPVLWVRVDPDAEFCKDVVVKQSEDSWTALLKGERDAVAQFEACRGLSMFASEMSAKALLVLLEDEQLYWRVRAEAATVLAKCDGGLEMLLNYFRSCYSDQETTNLGLVRPNNFSNLANYFVKRAMIKAVVGARVKGSRSQILLDGSIPVEAISFLSWILSTNDNAGNEFDDDHYVVDLIETCGKVAVSCLGDVSHEKAGEDGTSTTESLTKQLERYRSIEELLPSSFQLVPAAIASALSDIELAKMVSKDKRERGALSQSILQGFFSTNGSLLRSIYELAARECSHNVRLTALQSLIKMYSGDLEVALWVIARCDRHSAGGDLLELRSAAQYLRNYQAEWGYIESPIFRYKLLDALSNAASSTAWGKTSPFLRALRRHTERAVQFCLRVLRLSVGDSDPRVRSCALRLAKIAWGVAIPVCLLPQAEYAVIQGELMSIAKRDAAEIVPMKTNESSVLPQITPAAKSVKPSKPAKSTKGSKAGKFSKSSKRRGSSPKSSLDILPTLREKSYNGPSHTMPRYVIDVEDDDGVADMISSLKEQSSIMSMDTRPVSPEISKPKTALATISKSAIGCATEKPIGIVLPKSVPPSLPKSTAKPSPRNTPSELTPESPKNGPKLTALNIPPSVPLGIPKSVPKSIPKSIPKSVPKSIPKSIPKGIPKGTPKSIPKNTSESVAVGVQKSVPKSVHKSVPKSVPKSVQAPKSVPKNAPKIVSKPVPGSSPSSVPESVPSSSPNSVPKTMLKTVSNDLPKGISKSVPLPKSMPVPKSVPKSIALSNSVPKSVPKSIPKSVPKSIPKSVPKSVPNSISSSAPVLKKLPVSVPRSIPKSIPESVPTLKNIPRSAPKSIAPSVSRSIPKSIPRSVPKAAAVSIPKSVPPPKFGAEVPFDWHPLDAEDATYFKRAWKGLVATEESKLRELKQDKRRSGFEGGSAYMRDGDIASRDSADPGADGGDSEPRRKKKKKKKKKRHLEDGEEIPKKKKKRKKDREEGGNCMEREPNFDDEFVGANGIEVNGSGGPSSIGRIGTLKFKRSSLVPVEKS